MRELFIYYRIPVADAAAARTLVDAFQARLRQRHPGLSARLLRRPDERDKQQTWMETYSFDSSVQVHGVTPELQAEIETQARALGHLIAGDRHTEVFIPCAS
jgi:uncharacterized iron-regulated membrane protein